MPADDAPSVERQLFNEEDGGGGGGLPECRMFNVFCGEGISLLCPEDELTTKSYQPFASKVEYHYMITHGTGQGDRITETRHPFTMREYL